MSITFVQIALSMQQSDCYKCYNHIQVISIHLKQFVLYKLLSVPHNERKTYVREEYQDMTMHLTYVSCTNSWKTWVVPQATALHFTAICSSPWVQDHMEFRQEYFLPYVTNLWPSDLQLCDESKNLSEPCKDILTFKARKLVRLKIKLGYQALRQEG